VESFRERVRSLVRTNESFLTVSYSRKVLNQTGDGHWSPIGGYDVTSDMVLILDQARFKYNAHWVPLVDLYRAMDTVDKDTKRKRGFFELRAIDRTVPPPSASAKRSSAAAAACCCPAIIAHQQVPLEAGQTAASVSCDCQPRPS